MRRRQLSQRPDNFVLKHDHPLAQGLVFAGLGALPGSTRYQDSSPYGNHGTLTNMEPATDWVWNTTLNRLSLDFVGASSQYITHAGVALSTAYTMAMWVTSPSNLNSSLWSNGSNSYFLSMSSSTYHLINSGGAIYWTWTGQSQTGTNHWAIVRNGTSAELFKNGISQGLNSPTSGTTNGTFTLSSICKYGTQYMTANGLCDIAGYARPLAQSEIQQLADPSNVMLSGLILPPKRKLFNIRLPYTISHRARYNIILVGNKKLILQR